MPKTKVTVKDTYDDFEAEYPVHISNLRNLPDFVSQVIQATLEAYQCNSQKSIDIHIDFDREDDEDCEEE